MSRSSRVYCTVNAANRAGQFGFGGEFTQRIMVGSSATYSNAFATVSVDERQIDGLADWSVFRLTVDGVFIKRALFNNKTKQFVEIALDAVATDVIGGLS